MIFNIVVVFTPGLLAATPALRNVKLKLPSAVTEALSRVQKGDIVHIDGLPTDECIEVVGRIWNVRKDAVQLKLVLGLFDDYSDGSNRKSVLQLVPRKDGGT